MAFNKINKNIIQALFEAKGKVTSYKVEFPYYVSESIGLETVTVKSAKEFISKVKELLKKYPKEIKEPLIGYYKDGMKDDIDISVYAYCLIDNPKEVIGLMFDLWDNYYNKGGVVQTKSTDVAGRPWEITRKFRQILGKSNVVGKTIELYEKICSYLKTIKTPIYAYREYGGDKGSFSKNRFYYSDAETSLFFAREKRFEADIVMPWSLYKTHIEVEPGIKSTDSIRIYGFISGIAEKPIVSYQDVDDYDTAIKFIKSVIAETVEYDRKKFKTFNDAAKKWNTPDVPYIADAPEFKFNGKNEIIEK